MHEVRILPVAQLGRDFIARKYIPEGRDEYYLRNEQNPKPEGYWRRLRARRSRLSSRMPIRATIGTRSWWRIPSVRN